MCDFKQHEQSGDSTHPCHQHISCWRLNPYQLFCQQRASRSTQCRYGSLWAILLICSLFLPASPWATVNDPQTIHIGILAEEGKTECFKRWRGVAAYLQQYNPQYTVKAVCLDFDEVEKAVYDGRVDFTITDPTIYVTLEYLYSASRIATLLDEGGSEVSTQFGGVLFTKSDRKDIQSIQNLRGKKLTAVDKTSFGGWLIQWQLLQQAGITPEKDLASISFRGSHRNVVFDVLGGLTDAGAVRTGILEQMVKEGAIDHNAYTIIKQQDDPSFPYARSTDLFPQWALAKMYHVSNKLAEQIMLSFFDINPDSEVAREARIQGWTIPLDYSPVHFCLKELKTGPYRYLDFSASPPTIGQLYRQYRSWVWGFTGLFIAILSTLTGLFILNRRISSVTTQLRREQRLQEKTMANLNEFKTTLDNLRDAIFMFPPDTLRFSYVNQGAIEQTGYPIDEMQNLTPLDLKPEFQEAQFREMLAPLLSTARDSITFTTNHRRKDGSLVPVEVFLQYIVPEQGKGRFLAFVRDITSRLAARKEREQLLTQLSSEQKLSSIGQLAAGIAHEINTPTQYVSSNIDFLGDAFNDICKLIKQTDQLLVTSNPTETLTSCAAHIEELKQSADWEYLDEEIPRAIAQSKEGIAKIGTIVLAMKEFSHPGCKEKQETDLNSLINTTVTVASNEWKYVAEIDKKLDPNLPKVLCLPNEMGQVILNILINAAHAIGDKIGNEREELKGRITLETRVLDQQIEVIIADTGGGIPEAIFSKIFDPFFTTKEVGRGTGQGLAICHDIVVNKHGGTIHFVSTEGEGTTFFIRLPLGNINHEQESPTRANA